LPLLALVASAAACEDEGEPNGDLPPGSPDDYVHLFDVTPYGLAACDQKDGRLRGQRELRFFSNGVGDVTTFSRSLQRYYTRHELAFFTRFAPARTDTGYALNADTSELEREARKAFPGVDLDSEDLDPQTEMRLVAFAANFILGPMIKFAERQGRAGTARTNVVLLKQLIRPGGEDLFPDVELAGLAVSPALLETFAAGAASDEAAIWDSVEFPANFTPMMFLDASVLNKLARTDAVGRDLVMAHEFGHTAALIHREVANNLMAPGITPNEFTCADGLEDDQIATIQRTLQVPVADGVPQSLTLDDGVDVGQRGGQHDGQHRRVFGAEHMRDLRALLAGTLRRPPSFLRPLIH
jgi:hypothetical protein